jgi:hypothetical protein
MNNSKSIDVLKAVSVALFLWFNVLPLIRGHLNVPMYGVHTVKQL